MTRTYNPNDASQIAFANLPDAAKARLTESDVYQILDAKFHVQAMTGEERINDVMRMCEGLGMTFSRETIEAVLQAEEAYLRQIGVIPQ